MYDSFEKNRNLPVFVIIISDITIQNGRYSRRDELRL